jgi:hypothetical protein
MALRHGRAMAAPGVVFLAVLLVVVVGYLQFGSGSVKEYSPLPKAPRYTALVTPMLMLVVGIWLARLLPARPILARLVWALVAAAALPCMLFLSVSSSERARNTLSVMPALSQVGDATLYSDFYSIRLLRLLRPEMRNLSVWFHANFDTSEFLIQAEPANHHGSYVLLDRQMQKIYTSPASYEMTLPATIAEPRAEWKVVWSERAYSDGSMTRATLEGMRTALRMLPAGTTVRERGDRYITDMIDNDRATLYWVP